MTSPHHGIDTLPNFTSTQIALVPEALGSPSWKSATSGMPIPPFRAKRSTVPTIQR